MWNMAVMVETLVVRLEIYFAHLMLAGIHEMAFNTATTYPFPWLIFYMCRDAGLSIRHCHTHRRPTGMLDIGLIKDEANVVAPRRGPRVLVLPLGKNLADMVEQALGAEATSRVPALLVAIPRTATMIPLAIVQKIDAYMDILLHNI